MNASTVTIGSAAPDFTLKDHEGRSMSLARFRGTQPVLLIFYPGDDTPGCTTQLCAIRDDWREFRKRNVAVFGVNHAGTDSHTKFAKKYGLTVSLLIDEGREVSKRYGATGKFFKNEVIKRSVVLVDKDGIIRYVKRGLPSDKEILAAIDAL